MELYDSLVAIGLFVAGSLFSLVLDPIKHWLRGPKLYAEPEKRQGIENLVTNAQGKDFERDHKYLRIHFRNDGHDYARDCRAYLSKIEKHNPVDGSYQPVFEDTMQLRFAYDQASNDYNKGIDLPTGITRTVDLVSLLRDTDDKGGKKARYEIEAAPFQERNSINRLELIKPENRYRLTAIICSANASPFKLELEFNAGNGNPQNLCYL